MWIAGQGEAKHKVTVGSDLDMNKHLALAG